MKKYLLLSLAVLFIYASSCKKDDSEDVVAFDHAAQAIIDNDSLINYFKTHYLDTEGNIAEIEADEEALYESDTLKSKTVNFTRGSEEIEYTLYYIVQQIGDSIKPVEVDMVNMSYIGMTLDDGEIFDRADNGVNFDLYSDLIVGMRKGAVEFHSGAWDPQGDGTYTYENNGKGYIFLPSGLAYANVGSGDIPANAPIYFRIEMNRVFHIDHDGDSILSVYENDDNGDYFEYDTDEDGRPNFLDSDDDGDGTLTIDENPDPNNDGDPADAENSSNADNPDLADYLDPNVPSK